MSSDTVPVTQAEDEHTGWTYDELIERIPPDARLIEIDQHLSRLAQLCGSSKRCMTPEGGASRPIVYNFMHSAIEDAAFCVLALRQLRATPTPSPAMPSREEIARIAKAAIENSWRSAPGFDTDHDHMAKCVADALALTSVDRASETGWMPIETAPRNSTLVELVVDYSDGEHPLNDAILACTIGFNGFDDNGEDEWKFAGWCWTHDHWVQGKGRPVAWRPSRLNAYDDGLPPIDATPTIAPPPQPR